MQIPEGWPTEEMIAAGSEVTMSMAANSKHHKRLAFRAMLSAAPTPPAPEVEPVGSINRVELFGTHVSVDLNSLGESLPDNTALYTHPANDGLRKAAEEVVGCFDEDVVMNVPRLIKCIHGLRAALEGK